MTHPDMHAFLALRRRYRAYLEEQNHVGFAQRYAAAILFGILGLFFVIGAIAFASGAVGGIGTGVACILLAFLNVYRNTPKKDSRMTLALGGVPVWAVLVQANHNLFKPGTGNFYCLVLFSFEPAGGHIDYMQKLASRVFDLKETEQSDPDLRMAAHYTTDERAYKYRRRPLPISFTGGPTVYCADLLIERSCLPNGFLTERVLPCIAEPGQQGALELLPWWMAAGQDSKPN